MRRDPHRSQLGADGRPLHQVGVECQAGGRRWSAPGVARLFGVTDIPSLPAGSSGSTYRVVLGKQVLSEVNEPGSLAVGVEKIIVHEKWNSFLIV